MGRDKAKPAAVESPHVKGEASSTSRNRETLRAGIFALVDAAKLMADIILNHQTMMNTSPQLFGSHGAQMLEVIQKKYSDLIFKSFEVKPPSKPPSRMRTPEVLKSVSFHYDHFLDDFGDDFNLRHEVVDEAVDLSQGDLAVLDEK